MRAHVRFFSLFAILLATIQVGAQSSTDPKTVPVGQALVRAVERAKLTGPGANPFHLKATVAPANSFIDLRAEIEEYWISPDKWLRTIHSKDFEQTIIVNGKSRFEKNSSEYYPKWLTDVTNALFEVVPAATIDEISKLDQQIQEPDGKAGQLRIAYFPSATDGKVTATWNASVDFDRRTGLLNWLAGTGFAAGFKHYRSFHNKDIATEVETFPPVPHGDLITRISELADLTDPPELLFDIPVPTPSKDQIRTVQVPEVEYRKLAVDPPVMKWPPVDVRPTSGTLTTYIVTDRSGKVRECKFITSNNMNLRESTIDLVKQWHFRPMLVDGIPVQVETTMTFAFNVDIVGEQAKFQAASFYFKRGRDLTFPRTDDSQPFHLLGKFEGLGDFAGLNGKYEELWLAPNRWWRQVTIGETPYFIETRVDDDHYSKPDLRRRPMDPRVGLLRKEDRLVDRVVSLFTGEFPGYAYYSPDTDWHMANVEFESLSLLRVAMAHLGDDGKMEYPRGYFFDQKGLVRARTNAGETITYNDFAEFSGKQVPRRIESSINQIHVLTAHIESIEKPKEIPDYDFFTLPYVKPDDWVRPSPW